MSNTIGIKVILNYSHGYLSRNKLLNNHKMNSNIPNQQESDFDSYPTLQQTGLQLPIPQQQPPQLPKLHSQQQPRLSIPQSSAPQLPKLHNQQQPQLPIPQQFVYYRNHENANNLYYNNNRHIPEKTKSNIAGSRPNVTSSVK